MNRPLRSNDIPLGIPCSVTSLREEANSVNQLEISLIRAIVQEDRGAMAQLYDIYYPRLQRFLVGIIQDRELVAELINDVMMVVWQKAAGFRMQSLVSSWIFGIAYRRAMDGIRKDQRYRTVLNEVPRQTPTDSSLNESITARDLNVFMKVLTPEQLAVAQLTFEFGYSYPEIAQILQIPVNTVKTRMFHARKSRQKAYGLGVTDK